MVKNTVTFLIKTLGPSTFYYHQIEKPLPHRWLVKRIQTEADKVL